MFGRRASAGSVEDRDRFESVVRGLQQTATTSAWGAAPGRIAPRRVSLDFGADVPLDWMNGALIPSLVMSSVSLLFPEAELAMVRELRRTASVEGSGVDLDAVRGFCAQERSHATAHTRSFEVLRAQGYDVDRVVRLVSFVLGGAVERRIVPLANVVSPRLMLAVFAGAEHWTAEMASAVTLDYGRFLVRRALETGSTEVDLNEMQHLFMWHGLEEIEHDAVVMDAFLAVGGSEMERRVGFAIVTAMLVLLGSVALADVAVQTRRLRGGAAWRELGGVRRLELRHVVRITRLFAESTRRYWRRGFRPQDVDRSQALSLLVALLPEERLASAAR